MASPGPGIVVGVDDSVAARAALAFALREAVRRGAAVQVVTAVAAPVDRGVVHGTRPDPHWPTADQIRHVAATHARRTVAEVSAELAEELDVLPVVTVTAVIGPAASALLRAARDAELVVVGSRRGLVSDAVLGSVSRECLLHATCPVTIVHAARPRRPAPAAP